MNHMRIDESEVHSAIHQLTTYLDQQQRPDGTWRFCFENGTVIDAYIIVLLRSLQYNDERIIQQLHQRIIKEQDPLGFWKLYEDENNGNLTATIDNVHALLCSGYSHADDDHIVKAKQYILSQGGITSSKGLLSKAMLATNGHIPWPQSVTSIPLEIMLLPSYSPINLYEFSGYSRVHLIPMLIMAKLDFHVQSPISLADLVSTTNNRDLDESMSDEYEKMQASLYASRQRLIGSALQDIAREKAVKFMLDRIEEDGTLYSYASSTILMIYALLSLGFDAQQPKIKKAINGLLEMRCQSASHHVTVQNSPSTIWDTALISYALQQVTIPHNHPSIVKANQYLIEKQHNKLGDWSLHNTGVSPGGWGFSETNTINPDVDDTTAALRAIYRSSVSGNHFQEASSRGLTWILSMQNKDGGWPAFEKNVDNQMLTWLALDGAKSAAIDPSTTDLTGRTLEYLGNYSSIKRDDTSIQRGVKWLIRNQEKDGSWYGKWGICYIYGTWAALTGLMAVGTSPTHPSIQKAIQWLLSIQNKDGGWGESCESDRRMHYMPLHHSTPSQTAWALDALIAAHDKPSPEINSGIKRLMALNNEEGWHIVYPTGAGLPGNFYVHYHSYRYIYPLLALSNYRRKYLS